MSDFAALVLSLPARDSTLRMRVWRALKENGCGVLRDGVYILPGSAGLDAVEKIESVIRSHGGFAMTFELNATSDEQRADLRRLFDRSAEYGALLRRMETARASLARLGARRARTEIRRMERSFEKIAAIDFYAGEAKEQAAAALAGLTADHQSMFGRGEPRASRRSLKQPDLARYQKRVWATRKSPWVDRLASAWLIRRFIDRSARFTWIARPSECPKKAIGFDFDGADFTHVGNRVTFEVLLTSFGLDRDPALRAIGAAVHFLDVGGIPVRDAKGIETTLKEARERAAGDDALLAEAIRTFDLLYSAYRSGAPDAPGNGGRKAAPAR